MGEKKVENKEERTIGALTPEQKASQQKLSEQADIAFGQMGDLSGLANGQMDQLGPAILALIEQSQAGARNKLDLDYKQGVRDSNVAASNSGIAGSSMEAIAKVLLSQTKNTGLQNLDSQASQAQLQMPFQLAKQKMEVNEMLARLGAGMHGQNIGIYSNERMGSGTSTGTQTQTGFAVSDLANIAPPVRVG